MTNKLPISILLIAIMGGSFCAGGLFNISEPVVIREVIEVIRVVEVEVVIEKEVPEYIFVIREKEVASKTRDFRSIKEFREVVTRIAAGTTYLRGNCVDHARDFVRVLGDRGYYAETEIDEFRRHMVIKGWSRATISPYYEQITLYDIETGEFKTYYSDSPSWYGIPTYGPVMSGEIDSGQQWGKGGKPK